MKILLYAPELQGHPQVYCRVIGGFLLEAGHDVAIAGLADKVDWKTRWPVLSPFISQERVECVDLRKIQQSASGGLSAEQLIQVQAGCRADATWFIDADGFAEQFRRIAAGEASRLRGRTCAIFARTAPWYPGEDVYTGEREPLVGPTLRNTLGRIKRSLFDRRNSIRYFYEQILIRRSAVDALIVKDERVVRHFGPPVYWMPEIYRVFDGTPEERRGQDWNQFAEPIQRFVTRAGPDNVLLYFGTGAWYKGYDWFLKLAQMDEGSFALHAGAPERGEKGKRYAYDVEEIRQDLLRQGRLFETRAFVESSDLVDELFSSINRFVSTHRLTLSSGTVLQALEAGKSVLTPDAGLVGWRTREFKLGGAYTYGDMEDLVGKWRAFKSGACDADVRNIRSFMSRFSREQTKRFFLNILTGAPA